MLNRSLRRLQRYGGALDARGDTIIEVFIAIGIVSLVLTSAYAVTNRNTQIAQKIQEQGQAQKLVERQIELLRDFDGSISDSECLSDDPPQAISGDACKNITAGGSGATYTLSIINKGDSVYAVSATWDVLGGQQANVTMYYRR